MPNPLVYVQLHTPDHPSAKQFYAEMFDWRLEDQPSEQGTYTEIDLGAGSRGGMMRGALPFPQWVPFVGVDDVAGATGKAERLGARVLVPPSEVPGKGTYSLLADPTGALVALWEETSRR